MEDPGPLAGYGDLTVSVRLISPAQDLTDFPDLSNLPVSTTVGQIKLLIGSELTFRNRSPAGMRVIYRGRLLDMDEKTLADVFGISTIQETRLQVLHIVLRDSGASGNVSAGPIPNVGMTNPFAPRPVPGEPATLPPLAAYQNHQPHGSHAPIAFAATQQRNDQYPGQYPTVHHGPQFSQAQPTQQTGVQLGGVHLVRDVQQELQSRGGQMEEWQMQQVLRLQQRHQELTQRYPQRQQEGLHMAEPSRQQGTQAQAYTTGATHGYVQNTARPNVYVLDSPTGPRAVIVSGIRDASRQSIVFADVDTVRRENQNLLAELIQQQNRHIQQQRQSYETLMRQNMQSVAVLRHLRQLHLQSEQMNEQQAAAQQRATQGQAGHLDPAVGAGQQQQQQQQQMQNLDANQQGLGLQPNNPGAGFLAAMWPHIWLLTRLVLFVWWFTNPAASWTRWIMVILIATAVFIYNTGVLDGFADQIWTPIRGHLDGLVNPQNANGPAGAQNGAEAQNAAVPAGEVNAAANGAGDVPPVTPPVGRAGGREPDPAQAAARLVAQRQINNGQRLRDFAQRLERIGIMFLASLAPGIAERHVALAEEREREERRRAQEAAEAAIAAAAEAQAQAEAAAAAAATAAEEGAKTTNGENAETGQGAQQVEPSLEDEAAAVDAQWQTEQQQQVERDVVAGVQ